MKNRKQFVEHRPGRPCRSLTCNREAQHIDDHNEGGWSPFYCRECDTERTARIDKSLREIGASMPTKTKKEPKSKPAKSITGEKLPDTREQIVGKLKAIQTANTTVENLKLVWDGAKDDAKQAKKSYELARLALHSMIHDIPQGTLFDQVSREMGAEAP